ncbi:hypothetical protein DSAG12_03079 [Promethearchaeum syntrophicum]|uniref:Uncharacterized protein n=1 Tax=Promethearchaeum syntrophicum TaxID=2594042 RepID=A0A5B9DEH7_9ARCH|nr:hypothetical protein [Candidatus Prometheoarchaeum syntrophicum]QEE17247.1 hypothetical protein DSAG12_03079 [Candidatus Prometheoarchaeum syntrophicum]
MQKKKNKSTANPIPRDILISLLKQYWSKTYIQDATFSFLRNISNDFIEDIEKKSSSKKDKLLIEMIKVLKGEQSHKALEALTNALIKVDNWKPSKDPNSNTVFAEEILLLIKDLDQSGIDILLDALIDDSDFDNRLTKINENPNNSDRLLLERSLSNKDLLNSFKVLKNRRLKEEIIKNGYYALDKITERLKFYQTGRVYEKLITIYKLLEEKYSIQKKTGFRILL